MACNADFVQFIVDQCSGAGDITVRKMMGDYCIYCNGVLFGLICDNNFYVKVTEAGEAVLEEVDLRQPYEGAKDYFYVGNVDNRDYLEDIVKATLPELLSRPARSRIPSSSSTVRRPTPATSARARLHCSKARTRSL